MKFCLITILQRCANANNKGNDAMDGCKNNISEAFLAKSEALPTLTETFA